MRFCWFLFGALLVVAAGCIVSEKEFAEAERRGGAPEYMTYLSPEQYAEAERVSRARPILPVEWETIGFEQLWETRLRNRQIASMYFMNGNIFAETRGHYFYKIRAKDGFVRWVYDLGNQISAEPFTYVYERDLPGGPPVYDEVYVLCRDTLHCIDEEEGFRIWAYELRYPASGPPFASRSHVYYGCWDDRMRAIDKKDLTQDWEYLTGGDINAGGQQKEPSVYFASWDGKVYCADASRGTINWTFPCRGPVSSTPYFYKNRLYVGSHDFYLYGIKTTDGTLEWKFPCESKVNSPLAIDTAQTMTVYCLADNNYFYAIDRKDGKLKWKLKDGVQLLLVGRQNAYVLTRNKEIAAVDNETGEVRWKKPFTNVDFFMTNPADARDIRLGKSDYCIYLGFKNGWIFAIREKEPF